ncbi:hypothetical protein E2C01_048929 [Portunus trituberculatus]|uniref:Uncharacterized protein n=1 Tax=Portunus trituberculatus TaxID=210409 RepID=A0A5B7GBH0_PORTR|nr:hypothetical protein [Portunus trituberculatus]
MVDVRGTARHAHKVGVLAMPILLQTVATGRGWAGTNNRCTYNATAVGAGHQVHRRHCSLSRDQCGVTNSSCSYWSRSGNLSPPVERTRLPSAANWRAPKITDLMNDNYYRHWCLKSLKTYGYGHYIILSLRRSTKDEDSISWRQSVLIKAIYVFQWNVILFLYSSVVSNQGSIEIIFSLKFIILELGDMRLRIKFILLYTILKTECLNARIVLH